MSPPFCHVRSNKGNSLQTVYLGPQSCSLSHSTQNWVIGRYCLTANGLGKTHIRNRHYLGGFIATGPRVKVNAQLASRRMLS